jgi:hypothetical protein
MNALNLNMRPLKWSFDSLKAHEPNVMRKALRHLMLALPARPRYFLLLWRAYVDKVKTSEAITAKKAKMLKLLALLGQTKPHVYFLLWKRGVTLQTIDELREKERRAAAERKVKMLKLLATLGKMKPYVYFMMWKRGITYEIIEEYNTTITKIKTVKNKL